MFNRSLRDLNLVGWCLVVVALGATAAVSIPVGRWLLGAVSRSTIREWRSLLVYVLAIPGLLAAVLVFAAGERLLRRLGISVRRSADGEGV